MLFLEPTPTPYDLQFRMLGIPVRVHPMFWLVSGIMGMSTIRQGFQFLAIWIGCVFVSILIHEMGHVIMGQVFGTRGHIVLYSFGGLAIGSNALPQRWQRIAVSFAGPLAGFTFLACLLGMLWISNRDAFPIYIELLAANLGIPLDWIGPIHVGAELPNRTILFAITQLIFINLMWGILNLLPIWPLDGGQISRELCEGVSPDYGQGWSLGLSMTVAGLLALYCVLVMMGKRILPIEIGSTYTAILFGILAVQSFQLMQQVHAQRRYREDPWDDDRY